MSSLGDFLSRCATESVQAKRVRRYPNGCIYRGEEETCCLCGRHWDEAPQFCGCHEPAEEPRED